MDSGSFLNDVFYVMQAVCLFTFVIGLMGPVTAQSRGVPIEHPMEPATSDWSYWYRPAEDPVFTTEHGNNHDAIFFVDSSREYPYKLIVSHESSHADLWRAKEFSWNSSSWELVSDTYNIAGHYEYDDGVRVDGTYYIYEQGNVYTFSGSLEEADGNWKNRGNFPGEVDDIGVYYEDGVFHIFGEYGKFPHGPDGSSLAHYRSTTGLGDWELVNKKAVDPNPDGGHRYGTGDPTIEKIEGAYYVFCDLETKGHPYRMTAWGSNDLNGSFTYLGQPMRPRSDETKHWDNYRVQDPDIAYVPDLSRYVIVCNMKDHDGTPGGDFPNLDGDNTRVIGWFYSAKQIER